MFYTVIQNDHKIPHKNKDALNRLDSETNQSLALYNSTSARE